MTELSDLAHRVAAGDVPVDALHANPGALMSPEAPSGNSISNCRTSASPRRSVLRTSG